MVHIFKTKIEAQEKLATLKGWLNASIRKNNYEDYFISGHAWNCKCGLCPILQKNGDFL